MHCKPVCENNFCGGQRFVDKGVDREGWCGRMWARKQRWAVEGLL